MSRRNRIARCRIAIVVDAVVEHFEGARIHRRRLIALRRVVAAIVVANAITIAVVIGIFVGLTIAVVVDGVAARLVLRSLLVLHARERRIDARDRTRAAFARNTRRARAAAAGIVFVDQAVAIIVLAVANLGAGRARNTRERSAGTRQRTIATFTHGIGKTQPAAAGIALVGRSIAVVIDTVADLRGRRPGRAIEHSTRTNRRTISALTLLPVGRAHLAPAGIVLVRRTIAVIVETIASFRLRLLIGIALEGAVAAGGRTGRTNARQTRRARHASARIAVVHHAVAIVVLAIACFSNGHPRRTRNASRAARRRAFAAFAQLSRRGAHRTSAGIAVVDHAVAIVILVIARLGRRLHRLRTYERAARA